MKISLIVATDLNNGIGKNNTLLCHLPADLKFFKATTLGFPIIMGRKTFESIGKPLPGRRNIIISRNVGLKIEGAEIYSSIQNAMARYTQEKIFIIGGAEIFNQSFHLANEIFRTLIKHSFEADVFFPEIKKEEFEMTWEECHTADEKNEFDYCFQKWERKK